MLVRNFNQKEVQQRLYKAHGAGDAAMLFDSSELQGFLFLAHGILAPGKVIEPHIDPYEEIYYILQGEGIMMVGGEEQKVTQGDATHIPYGSVHSLKNKGTSDCIVLIMAAMPR